MGIIIVIILMSTLPLFKETSRILLQRVAPEIDTDHLKVRILKIPGVINFHDLDVWNLNNETTVASIHVTYRKNTNFDAIVNQIKSIFHVNGIHASTIQGETGN